MASFCRQLRGAETEAEAALAERFDIYHRRAFSALYPREARIKAPSPGEQPAAASQGRRPSRAGRQNKIKETPLQALITDQKKE